MAGNIFLFLDGIPGESAAKGFENWINIADFSLGNTMEVDQEARTGSGGGTSGAADPEDLSCSKKMSIATPILLECCASGAIIPRGKLIQCNVVNEQRIAVSDYCFGDSIITSVNLSGSGGAIPDESFTLNYGSIIWHYHYYKHNDFKTKEGEAVRQWSLLSSAMEADPSAKSIHSAARWEKGSVKDPKEGGPGSYTDIGPANVQFAAGPVVDVTLTDFSA